ncbi:MAG: DUF4292 domain-containing protein [Bacteroidetes bacterium]|nr:DUF4292 domain-containing protein [Bacteroidota bacterium]
MNKFYLGNTSFVSIRMDSRFLLLMGALVFLFSCKTTRKIVDTPPAPVKLKGEEVITVFDSVMARQFYFEWLTAKATVDYTDKSGETTTFDVNLRVRKDSAIWISITPLLGIEAARVLINRDSLMILDRVHRTFSARDYNYLEDMLKTGINYDMIQAVIVGNYFPYLKNEKLKSMYEEDPYIILSTLNKRQSKRVQEEKDPTKPIIQDFWIDGNYRIAKSKITDDKKDRWIEATYKNFMDVNSELFPGNLVVTISSASPIIIKLEYTKVTANEEFTMPFSVPEKYERK